MTTEGTDLTSIMMPVSFICSIFVINVLCVYLVEMMDSSTFKRFTASMDNILESLEDVDLNGTGQHEVWLFFPSLLKTYWIVELRNVFFL